MKTTLLVSYRTRTSIAKSLKKTKVKLDRLTDTDRKSYQKWNMPFYSLLCKS